jgi:hypothetical protein
MKRVFLLSCLALLIFSAVPRLVAARSAHPATAVAAATTPPPPTVGFNPGFEDAGRSPFGQ